MSQCFVMLSVAVLGLKSATITFLKQVNKILKNIIMCEFYSRLYYNSPRTRSTYGRGVALQLSRVAISLCTEYCLLSLIIIGQQNQSIPARCIFSASH